MSNSHLATTRIIILKTSHNNRKYIVLLLQLLRNRFHQARTTKRSTPFIITRVPNFIPNPTRIKTTRKGRHVKLRQASSIMMAVPIMMLNLTILTLTINTIRPSKRSQPMLNRRLNRLTSMRIIMHLTLTMKFLNTIPQKRMRTRLRSIAPNKLTSLAGRITLTFAPQQQNSNIPHRSKQPRTRSIIILTHRSSTNRPTNRRHIRPLIRIRIPQIRRYQVLVPGAPLPIHRNIRTRIRRNMRLRTLPNGLTQQ